MKVESLRELKALIKMCQSQGVKAIEIDNIKLELNPPAPKQKRYKQVPEFADLPLEAQLKVPQMEPIPTDELTEEQLMYYSAENPQQ